jgi:hypothetical protein
VSHNPPPPQVTALPTALVYIAHSTTHTLESENGPSTGRHPAACEARSHGNGLTRPSSTDRPSGIRSHPYMISHSTTHENGSPIRQEKPSTSTGSTRASAPQSARPCPHTAYAGTQKREETRPRGPVGPLMSLTRGLPRACSPVPPRATPWTLVSDHLPGHTVSAPV